tara:strand:- start:1046 stop:1264 length:219 start_codon:yes stop_codon:yes gene_type:complete
MNLLFFKQLLFENIYISSQYIKNNDTRIKNLVRNYKKGYIILKKNLKIWLEKLTLVIFKVLFDRKIYAFEKC